MTKADASKAASQAFIFFGLGELCAIAICILTFFGEADYQQNMNLIEDLLGIVFHLILCVFALFGVAFARSRTRDVMAAYMNWLHDHSAITSGAE